MSALTPMKLNEQIISMRKSVGIARVRLCRRLIRQRKLLQKSRDEKKARKVDRIAEEINYCKKVCRDDVSKFALVNLKTLNDLLKKDKISANERVLYKLACQETVVKSVAEFRVKYPNWKHEVSFLLQRLGLQYKSKRDAKKYELQQSGTKEVVGTLLGKKIENAEDVKMLVKKEIRKAMKKEENLEKKKKKLKDRTKSSEPKEIPVPVLNLPKLEFSKPVIAKGQAVIKLLSLNGNQDDEFPSVSIPDRDVVLQRHTSEDIINGNDEAMRSSLPVKTRNAQKRKRDLRCERREKRKDALRQNKSEAESPSEAANVLEVLGNTTKLSENQNLHPSWIAKKQEYETLKKLKASCKASRIVFSDD